MRTKLSIILLLTVLASGIVGATVYLRRTYKYKKVRPHVNVAGEPQLVVNLGHFGGVNAAAYSPDGRFIVTAGNSDHIAILWEAKSGREIRRFKGHEAPISSVVFAPDGKSIVTGSGYGEDDYRAGKPKDNTARLWDIATGKEIRSFKGHDERINSVAFSPDGSMIVTGSSDRTARLWRSETGEEIKRLSALTTEVHTVAFSPKGDVVLTGYGEFSRNKMGEFAGCKECVATLWNVSTGNRIHDFSGENHPVESVAFSSDGNSVYLGVLAPIDIFKWQEIMDAGFPNVKEYEVESGQKIKSYKGFGPAAISSSTNSLVTVGVKDNEDERLWQVNGISAWDTQNGEEKSSSELNVVSESFGSQYSIRVNLFSPDGLYRIVIVQEFFQGGNSYAPSEESIVAVYKTDAKNDYMILGGSTNLSTLSDKPVADEEAEEASLAKQERIIGKLSQIEFSQDRNMLLAGGRVWSTQNSSTQPFFRIPKRLSPSQSEKVDHEYAFNIRNGEVIKCPKVDAGYAEWLAPNNRYYLVEGFSWGEGEYEDSSVALTLFDLKTGKQIWRYDSKVDMAQVFMRSVGQSRTYGSLSPDGEYVYFRRPRINEVLQEESFPQETPPQATEEENIWEILQIDIATGEIVNRRETDGLDNMPFTLVSPDSKTIAVPRYEGLNLYNLNSGKEINLSIKDGVTNASFNPAVFSPDSKKIVTLAMNMGSKEEGEKTIVSMWETGGKLLTQAKLEGLISQVVFSPDGKYLLVSQNRFFQQDNIGKASMLDAETLEIIRDFPHSASVISVGFSPDNRIALTSGADGTRLWNTVTGKEICRLVSFANDDWVVVAPDNRFDTNNLENLQGVHWVLPDAPLDAFPLEIFMREYYEPRLLSRILAEDNFKSLPSLAELNRTQPEVKITEIKPDSTDTVQVTLELANVKSETQKDISNNPIESGVFDVRLFRDGQLVGYAPKNAGKKKSVSIWSWLIGESSNDGEVELNSDGKTILTFSKIKLPRTGVSEVEFSAYAFNYDRIKSATYRKSFALPKTETVKGRAVVISVGVNGHENDKLNLRFAANDARQTQEGLTKRLTAQGNYTEVVNVPLISDYTVMTADGRSVVAQDATNQDVKTGQKRITENAATKAHLKAVLDVLAGRQADAELLKAIPNADKLRPANPEDLIIISVSSHGYTDSDGIFYIVPSDTGTSSVSSKDFREHCVSSDELSLWLRDVDAGELVLIVDACHSSAAVEGTDFKPGPMGSRGLGQLSYDKGMRILTATQAADFALEKESIRQGLLTFALLKDGLDSGLADTDNDKNIMLPEWLKYGVQRVPRLHEQVKTGQSANKDVRIIRETVDVNEAEESKTQQPSLFDFSRKQQRDVVIARKP